MLRASQTSLLNPLRLGDEVNFRLTYDGPLKAASQSDTRRVEKHAIRTAFNTQLNALYDSRKASFLDAELREGEVAFPYVQYGDFDFMALVREKLHLVCDLDILFLRRENPGQLVTGGGDLDNRIKVLFDALRIPQDENEIRGLSPPPEPAPGPFFLCLAEDDKLITGFRITTDRLLEPAKSPTEQNNVRLIINVEVKVTKLTPENMAYFSHF